jgi:hypothetical protein
VKGTVSQVACTVSSVNGIDGQMMMENASQAQNTDSQPEDTASQEKGTDS